MKITVAGNKKEYEDGITVAELIVKENVENPEYVTVTVNDDFIMRGESPTILKDILKGKKLTFAYKLNQSDFLSAQIDLSGLKENIDFANAVIKTNE